MKRVYNFGIFEVCYKLDLETTCLFKNGYVKFELKILNRV